MDQCAGCGTGVDGEKLCRDCLELLGIHEDTANRLGLLPADPEPDDAPAGEDPPRPME